MGEEGPRNQVNAWPLFLFMTIKCMKCGGRSKVSDSRTINERSKVRRRRICLKCGYRWSTVEIDASGIYFDDTLHLALKRSLQTSDRLCRQTEELRSLILQLQTNSEGDGNGT